MPDVVTRRVVAAALLVCAVAAGIGIHYGMPRSTFSDVAGDVLYTVAAYLLVVLVLPRWSPWLAGAVAGGWCVAVELFQLTGIPLAAGAAFPPAMLVLGTVFDPRDLVVYAVTAIAVAAVDAAARALHRGRRAS